MVITLTPEEVKKLNEDMVAWVKETLEGTNSTNLYNILLELQRSWGVK